MENPNPPATVPVEISDLLYLETLLIELVADTGPLHEAQQPITARACLLALLHRVQAMLPAPQLFPTDPYPAGCTCDPEFGPGGDHLCTLHHPAHPHLEQ